jgi:outer membrane lipoprotein SlyB
MKHLSASLALAAALVTGCSTPYAPQDFDFSELDSLPAMAVGTVESIGEVPVYSDLPLADVFEHSVRPETGTQLVIRLDDGRAIRVMPQETQSFEAGQRVRLFRDQVEHE